MPHNRKRLVDAAVCSGHALQTSLNNALGPGERLRKAKRQLMCTAIPYVWHDPKIFRNE